MIQHFCIHGYISTPHKQRIDQQGASALHIEQIVSNPDEVGVKGSPAFRINGAFDIDEAEILGIWRSE